jgi:outer membrane protein insertion porin family
MRRFFSKSLFTVCFSLLFLYTFAQQKEYNIAAIRIEGIYTLENAVIASLSGLRVGQTIEIPGYDVSNAIKTLWKQGLFSDIKIIAERYDKNNVFLLIKVEEKPRMSKYRITGVKKGDVDDIRGKISLRTGTVYNDNIKTSITNTIKEFYKDKGFINTEVAIETEKDTTIPNSVALSIEIKRGLKYRIDDISFIGNNEASDHKLKKAMEQNKEAAHIKLFEMLKFKKHFKDTTWTWYDRLGAINPKNVMNYLSTFISPNIFKGAKYNPIDLKTADRKAIKEYYASIGHRDAEVVWDTTIFGKNQNVGLVLKVNEGKKYYYRNITWVGNTKYTDTILGNILSIRKGDIYNSKKMEEKLQQSQAGDDVSSLYMDDGYLFFNIDPVEVAVVGDSIDIQMRVYEGQQATINNINISGNEKTNEKVIRRELRIKPGDKFDRSKLIRTQREIAALGYFNPETMQILPKPKDDGTVDIDLVVEEKPSDQLSLSLGYANFVYGQVGLNFTNFSIRNLFKTRYWKPLPSGDGQTLSLNVQSSGLQSQIFNISFSEPWLGGKKPTSLQISGTHSRFNNVIGGNTITGSYVRTNGSIEVGTRLKWPDDYFTAFFGITAENNNLTNYQFFTGISDGNVNNVFGRFTLTRNSLQGPIGPQLYPTSGSTFTFSLQATLPYSQMFQARKLNYSDANLSNGDRWNWIEYYKTKFSTDIYTPIAGNLVARLGIRFGALGYYNSSYGLSPFERFRIGGDGLVAWNQFGQETFALRGYNDNEVTINDQGEYFQGATVFNKYLMELRYPISLNPQSTIYGMLFAEAGNGWEGMRNYDPFKVKKSFGAGVRFFLPMFGLLGFDYGFGVDKEVPSALQGGSIFEKYGKFRFILGFEPQ